MPTCSVVIVSYYSGPSLLATIKTVLKQKNLAELIVVNNENPPDMLARLQQMALGELRLNVVTGQGNVGFAKASNIGAKKATGDFILLLNPSCILPPDALADAMAGFEEIPGVMLAGCTLQQSDGSERAGCKPLLTPARLVGDMLGITRLVPMKKKPSGGDPLQTHEVPAISSDFMLARTADYHRLYGMDEGYFHHIEDADFCLRVRNSGGKIICVPRVKITYLTLPEGKPTTRAVEWNRVKGYARYFNTHFQGKTAPGLVWLADAMVLLRFGALSLWMLIAKPQEVPREKNLAAKRLLALAIGAAEIPETEELAGVTVLLTGAKNHIGISVLRRLLASGATVIAMSRNEALPYRHERLRWSRGNLIEKPWNLHGQQIGIAIHCAPLVHLPPAIAKMEQAGVKRLIAFSSTEMFRPYTRPYKRRRAEELALAEADIKAQCEDKKIEWTILRPTFVYGGGLAESLNMLAAIIRRFGCFVVYPPALGKRQPVHADDLAIAAMRALRNERSYKKGYNLSGAEVLSYRDMLARIFQAYGKKARIFASTLLPFALDVAGHIMRKPGINGEIAHGMNDDQAFFHDDAAKDFGYTPRKFLLGGIRDIEGF